jgi:putative molybdopterin biosynthesis protein
MDEGYLYHQIAEAIRQDILEGRIEPGDKLPAVRELTGRWNCTPGTVQRAYQELAHQGLVTSRPGKGTLVSIAEDDLHSLRSLRKAALVNRAEAFLLETLATGHKLEEIERAFTLAADRWRSVAARPELPNDTIVRIGGSHDPVLTAVVAQLVEISGTTSFEVRCMGSLGGLIALAEGKLDLAGCHLWDKESQSYNLPYVQRLLPGRPAALIHLALRRLGLMVQPGNPMMIGGLDDLTRMGLRFANRQAGSGTRVWLDAQLAEKSIDSKAITGYENEFMTHSEVARAVAGGKAEVGLGLEASACELGLDFIFLSEERYDLVCLKEGMQRHAVAGLLDWLRSPAARMLIKSYPGYDGRECGQVTWL